MNPTASVADPAEDDPVLADLVERLTAQLQAGETPDLSACARQHPEYAGQLRELLPALKALAGIGKTVVPATGLPLLLAGDGQHSVGGQLGDYRIVREVGRGGMGVVYEAEQTSLGRRVALKVLPFAAAWDPRQLQRFKHEAQAAAHLHHTNIVPVFAVGCAQDVHYYAMQFIDGHSLAAVIQHLRARGARGGNDEGRSTNDERNPNAQTPMTKDDPTVAGPGFGFRISDFGFLSSFELHPSSFFRTAAQLGVQAAEALEYAHQVGVVHRDIKPANLLLEGRAGGVNPLTLWITDFGVASFAGGGSLTRTGDMLGTLRYMSPEQALAKRGLVDHRTDLYGLGATLYELLTLRPVFEGRDREELLLQIACEEVIPPRHWDPAIPVELETIVLKALAKNVEERYGTAQELADDLRRFLEDKPILAKRPGVLERLRKWRRRHKLMVRAAAAVAFLAVMTLAVSTAVIRQKYGETRAALQEARLAVDTMYSEFAERWLARYPHLDTRERDYLQKALQFYERFTRNGRTDPGFLLETGRAYRRLADIHQKLEAPEKSAEAYQQAVAILRDLLRRGPADPEVRGELAIAYNNRGNLLRTAGRLEEAKNAYRLALTGFARLTAGLPEEPRHRAGLAGSSQNLGLVLHALGQPEDAQKAFRQAVQLLGKLAAAAPDDASYVYDLAESLTGLALVRQELGQAQEAEQALHESAKLWDRLLAAIPTDPAFRHGRATTERHLARLLAATGRPREAEAVYARVMKAQEQLTAEYPRAAAFRRDLAATCHDFAYLLATAGRLKEAEALYQKALKPRTQLAAAAPGVPAYRQETAATHAGLGMVLAAAGQGPKAEASLRAALTLQEQLARDFPTVPAYRHELAVTLDHLGMVLAEAGRAPEAEAFYHRAVDRLESLTVASPGVPAHRAQAAALHLHLGQLLETTGRLPEAERAFQRGVELTQPLAALDTPSPLYRSLLANGLGRLGSLAHRAGRSEAAAPLLERSLTLRNQLAADYPLVPAFQADLAWALATCPQATLRDSGRGVALARKAVDLAGDNGSYWTVLGAAYYQAGDDKAAIQALEKSVQLRSGGEIRAWLFLALAYERRGDHRQARQWSDRARQWLDKHPQHDPDLRRFRTAALALLGRAD
jgi:serine/threonine protein kinase/Tfp pilus assembly protein PilF